MSAKDFDYIMNKVAEFSDRKFGSKRPFEAPLHHLKKEVNEAIESGKIEEFADMQLLLLDAYRKKFPNLLTEDLVEACDFKLDICENRKWNEPDENGVIEHVREENESTNNNGLHLHDVNGRSEQLLFLIKKAQTPRGNIVIDWLKELYEQQKQ